ncbi:vitelline envelope sperm lysin receptor-like [Haliotis rubra]|uniref:vitelline envelope sperm lysin receptor-like n=1 Tax=Haliotis rubra TaxID=36100 RepID=UPI001EE5A927|nr:vitelline envelope sperm lysin receptor-like [Haliotis rubra]XP_046551255.1 vitelline envelope sperm lysin receptor-like [Haliotis rubra]
MIRLMFPAVVAVLQLLLLLNMTLAIPPGYVLEVKHTCGATLKEESQVTIVTDLKVLISVECKDETMAIQSSDSVNYNFKVAYEGDPTKKCVFKSRKHAGIRMVLLSIKWSEPREKVQTKKEQYLITCTLDPTAVNQTAKHETKEGLLGPTELQQQMGAPSTSQYFLQVADIYGRRIKSHVAIGRKIQLLARMKAANKEKGFRAVSCNAQGGEMSYSVLRGGCGDGIVFPRNQGFITKGFRVRSPYFGAFKLTNEPFISFKCNFTSCKNKCDGDSCKFERRRRDTRAHEETPSEIRLSSDHLNIYGPEAGESRRDMAQRMQELAHMGIDVVPESCNMSSQGMVCRAVQDDSSILNVEDRDGFYGVLAVGLLLVQACVTLGLVGGLVLASRRDRRIEKSSS